ncbi:MAG: hypothetical protein NVS4B1_14060 [Ktedonobacteraceae bacterium]
MLVAQSKNSDKTSLTPKHDIILPYMFLVGMIVAWIIVDGVLPLQNLYFASAQLASLSQLFLLPSHILFPGYALTQLLFQAPSDTSRITSTGTWSETALLLCSFLLLFLCYLLALKYLPRIVGMRFIFISSCLFGVICMLIPVVTSPDLYSYIIYARMVTLYHLNPLVTTPLAIPKDIVYTYLYWKDQPSAYGPTWIMLSGLLQWGTAHTLGVKNISAMVLSLRLLGLFAHLWSTLLVWSLGGHLQRLNGTNKPRIRILATLAFAWNPLLLFEACVNAHNDTVMLLLILLGFWMLIHRTSLFSYVSVALLFALATCLKANVVLLIPGLLLFLWLQPRRIQVLCSVLFVYIGTIIVLYAQFWEHGAMLNILAINPGTFRNENTLVDFIGQLYNAVQRLLGHALVPDVGSQAERVTHMLSLGLFVLAYTLLCLQALVQSRLSTPLHLIRWMTTVWFLYCLLGSPWFWPWYAVTFFGLFALVEASATMRMSSWNITDNAYAARIFAFTLLSSYCFLAWGLYHSFIPLLQGFRWAYLRGLWIWGPVLLLLLFRFRHKILAKDV